MKNMELLIICYKFFNILITADKLIEMLDNMDKSNLSKKELESTNELINGIKEIANNIPNEEDEFVKNRKEQLKSLIEKIKSIPVDTEKEEYINEKIRDLEEDYKAEMDSKERWSNIVEYINENKYFTECFDSLTDYELLQLISNYINVPFPPQITEEKFQDLVNVGIENDKREYLWRLAFNYEDSKFNFEPIIDYFIKVKDGYYLVELISAIGEYLNIDSIIDKINDKELMEYMIKYRGIIEGELTEEQINKFKEKYNSIK